jgi:tetratricopeptide (TPR) repeat protein
VSVAPVGHDVRCPVCGSTRDASLPDGLCARCLLTFALDAESGVFEDDAATSGEQDVAAHPDRCMGRYQLRGEIDRGGVGIVYRAWQADLKREVALKMLLPTRLETTDALNRFRREAELMASLDHAGILPVYEVGEQDGLPYYSMKLAEGGNLAARVAALRGQFRECARLVAVLARAIGYAHGRGILHRDLKPSNIVFDLAGQCMVTDFGLARRLAVDSSLTGIDALIGTPRYVAPEVLTTSGARLTTATDVYGLGAILYELLSGCAPFTELTPVQILQQLATRRPRPPRQLDAAISPVLEAICLRCLEKRPGDRFASADALADALDNWLARPTRGARRWLNRLASQPLPSRRRTLWWIATSAIMIAAIALTIVSMRPEASMPDPHIAASTLFVVPVGLPTPPASELAAARALSARLQGTQPLAVAPIEAVLRRTQAVDFSRFPFQRAVALGAFVQVDVLAVDASPQPPLRVRAIDALRNEVLWQGKTGSTNLDGAVRELAAALQARWRTPPPEAELSRAALAALARGADAASRREKPDNDAAIEAFQQAVALAPKAALAHALLADAYRQRGEVYGGAAFWVDSAIEEAERAARLDPSLAWANDALGVAYADKGWLRRSTAVYEQARLLGSFAVDSGLALNYYQGGRFDESFQLNRKSFDFWPRSIGLPIMIAEPLFALGATDAGEHWLQTAIAREPVAEKRGVMNAEIAMYRGDYARCRALAATLDPATLSGYYSANLLGKTCAERQHDWAAALALVEHDKQPSAAGIDNPGSTPPALEEAVLLDQLGRRDEALGTLAAARRAAQAAIDSGREHPKTFLRMATVLRLDGDIDAAYRMLDSAFEHGLTINARSDNDFEFLPFQNDARFAELRKTSLAKVAAMRERLEKTLSAEDLRSISQYTKASRP